MTQTNETMLAMALCEEVYRRAVNDQQIGKTTLSGSDYIINSEGFGGLVNGDLIARSGNIPRLTKDGGFYYNNATGFVGQIIEANGSVFVVYRGSDLSSGFWSAAGDFYAGLPSGNPGIGSTTADPYDFGNDRRLGEGTIEQSQLQDALALLAAAKAIAADRDIIVTGQSLGGGLAGLVTANANRHGVAATAPEMLAA